MGSAGTLRANQNQGTDSIYLISVVTVMFPVPVTGPGPEPMLNKYLCNERRKEGREGETCLTQIERGEPALAP